MADRVDVRFRLRITRGKDIAVGPGKVKKDGTRAASLPRADLDQLLGYTLMDYSDTYALHTVAIYAARFGFLATWPLNDLITDLEPLTAKLTATGSQ